MSDSENSFYNHYIAVVKKLKKKYDFITVLDTKKYITKNMKEKKLFCDSMHQNLEGKKITGKIISKLIHDRK